MREVRSVVVVPSFHDFYATPRRHSGLGARIVYSILVRHGITCNYIHFPAEDSTGTAVPLPESMEHLHEYLLPDERGRVSFFRGYRRFGPSHRTCAATLLEWKPHIIFISCFAFQYIDESRELARELRAAGFDGPICAGGAGACAAPERLLGDAYVDLVCIGEAEVSLPPFVPILKSQSEPSELRKTLRSKVTTIHTNTTLPTAPPDAMEVPFSLRTDPDGTVRISTSLSRGCPRRCSFCSAYLCHGREYRTIPLDRFERTLDRLTVEIQERDLSRVVFNFEDDNLTASPEYFTAVLHAARRRFPGVRFSAENGLDFRFLTEESARRLVELGFLQVDLSLGTISDLSDRKKELDRFESVVTTITGLGVPCTGYFICGSPGDTPAGIVDVLLYLSGLPLRVGISLFYPVPGLPGFEDSRRFDPVPSQLTCGSTAYPWTGSLTTAELITAFRLARVVNLCKDGCSSEEEEELLRRVLAEGRLYTFRRRKRRTILAPVPGMSEEMCRRFSEEATIRGLMPSLIPSLDTPSPGA